MECVHEIQIEVKNYEIDINEELKLNSIFNYFQFLASEHADLLGFGYDNLNKTNLIWILSGLKVDIKKYPKWKEILKLKTITKGLTGIYAIRNFELYNKKNELCVEGISSWLMIDKQSFRPARPLRHPELDAEIFFENKNIKPLSKILLSELKTQHSEYQFKYDDIDLNLHVNNAKYVELVINCFDLDFYKKFKITDFQINFLHQARFNDIVKIYIEKTSDTEFKIEGLNSETGKQVFVSDIKYQ